MNLPPQYSWRDLIVDGERAEDALKRRIRRAWCIGFYNGFFALFIWAGIMERKKL